MIETHKLIKGKAVQGFKDTFQDGNQFKLKKKEKIYCNISFWSVAYF